MCGSRLPACRPVRGQIPGAARPRSQPRDRADARNDRRACRHSGHRLERQPNNESIGRGSGASTAATRGNLPPPDGGWLLEGGSSSIGGSSCSRLPWRSAGRSPARPPSRHLAHLRRRTPLVGAHRGLPSSDRRTSSSTGCGWDRRLSRPMSRNVAALATENWVGDEVLGQGLRLREDRVLPDWDRRHQRQRAPAGS